jgi:hypothetical protein
MASSPLKGNTFAIRRDILKRNANGKIRIINRFALILCLRVMEDS